MCIEFIVNKSFVVFDFEVGETKVRKKQQIMNFRECFSAYMNGS